MRKRLLWKVVFVALAVSLGLAMSAAPWRLVREHVTEADTRAKEARRAEAERKDLAERKAYLESRPGREEQARKLGYRKPGETPADLGD
jgi:hypothetical protein